MHYISDFIPEGEENAAVFSEVREEKRLAAERAAIRYYTVKKGDSLGAIARKQGKSLAAIKKLNPGINPDKLSIGQKIRVN